MNPFRFVVIFSENRLGKSVTIRSGYSANRDFFFLLKEEEIVPIEK